MFYPTIALIPAYEPNLLLAELARRLSVFGFTVVIVDDGSGAEYRTVFQRAGKYADVIYCHPNRGKGSALKAGYRYIRQNYEAGSIVVTLDSDGQHTPEDARRVAEKARQCPGTLVLGVRAFGEGTPARSRFGNTVTRAVFHLSTGLHVSDTQTGLRAFDVALLPFLAGIPGRRYEYEMNVLLRCAKQGIPIAEEPIQTIYMENNRGSHFHTLRDSVRVYAPILKFAASSLTGFLIDYSLYTVLTVCLAGLGSAVSIPLSNVAARTVSASANFAINKYLVFRNTDSALKTGVQYFLLAAVILAGNTLLLSALVNAAGMNPFAAKLITEIAFFTFSWVAQRCWIFRRERTARQAADD